MHGVDEARVRRAALKEAAGGVGGPGLPDNSGGKLNAAIFSLPDWSFPLPGLTAGGGRQPPGISPIMAHRTMASEWARLRS